MNPFGMQMRRAAMPEYTFVRRKPTKPWLRFFFPAYRRILNLKTGVECYYAG